MSTTAAPGDSQHSTDIASWQRLFWYIGGFDCATLSLPQCRALRPKYSSMGALVLLTALLASCSGGYAIYTVFRDLEVTLLAGALWGLLILSLDRFLVSSTRKLAVLKDFNTHPNALPPYKQQQPWLTLAIRLPLAAVIGLVVSVPIDTRLMQPLINDHEHAQAQTQRQSIAKDPTLMRLQKEIDTLEARVDTKSQEVSDTSLRAAREADGTGGSHQRGAKQIWEKENGYYLQSLTELNELNDQLAKAKQQFVAEHDHLAETVQNDTADHERHRSIISDLSTLRELAAAPGPDGDAAWAVSAFLTLLFALIECIPVLAKTISPFDAYDAALQEIEYTGILDSLVETRRRYAEASLSE